MRRGLLTGILGAVAGLACAVLPATAAASPPRAALTHFGCRRAPDPMARTVSVRVIMRPVPGTQRLQVRFQLLEKDPGASAARRVRGGDLGAWITPDDPTLGQEPGDVWRLDKPVHDLYAPARYRFRVTFRWEGAGGRVLDTATRVSRVCHQPQLRPDLAVRSLTAAPVAGHPDQSRYTAVIANRGGSGAGPFEVLFDPGSGWANATIRIRWLGRHRQRAVSFTGPACQPADPPTVTADPTHRVADDQWANNRMTADCGAAKAPKRRGTRTRSR